MDSVNKEREKAYWTGWTVEPGFNNQSFLISSFGGFGLSLVNVSGYFTVFHQIIYMMKTTRKQTLVPHWASLMFQIREESQSSRFRLIIVLLWTSETKPSLMIHGCCLRPTISICVWFLIFCLTLTSDNVVHYFQSIKVKVQILKY